jgi:hypothetical protein
MFVEVVEESVGVFSTMIVVVLVVVVVMEIDALVVLVEDEEGPEDYHYINPHSPQRNATKDVF